MSGVVVVVGSANLDLVARAHRLPLPGETLIGHDFFEVAGGKGLNQAVAAARAGASVRFVGAVGDDDAGRALLRVMDDDDIDRAGVAVLDGVPTGRALIGVGDDGANSIIVVPGANARVDATAVRAAGGALAGADVVLLQHEIPDDGIEVALRLARAGGARTVLNPAPARPIRPEVLALVDVLVPNEHEHGLIGDVAGVPVLVVTEAERGAAVYERGQPWRVPAFPVTPVDTTAAGDAFCGVLAAGLASGLTLASALERAAAAGALSTLTAGAVPSLPRADQIDALVSRG